MVVNGGTYNSIKVTGISSITDAYIGGNSVFAGKIKSGPLYLSDEGATATYTLEEDSYIKELVTETTIYNIQGIYGTYNSIDFDAIQLSIGDWSVKGTGPTSLYCFCTTTLKLYKEGDRVFKAEKTYTESVSPPVVYTYQYSRMPITITYKKNLNEAKTFKLFNLPDGDPKEKGRVYVINNTLMISNG